MSNEHPSNIPPREIAELTQANRVVETTESFEHIVASTMLRASALKIREFSVFYDQLGMAFDPNINVLNQIPEKDRPAVGGEIGKAMLGISVMVMEKAKRSGVLTDTDITDPYNEAFEGTFMPKLSGKFTYKLSKKEMKKMQEVTEKSDRTYGIYFTDEISSLLPPIKELIEGNDYLDLIRRAMLDYQTSVVKLIKLRAIAMENDSIPRDH